MTSKMEDDLKNGRLPPSRFHPYITRGYVEPFIARGHVEPFITCDPTRHPPPAMTLGTLVPHGTNNVCVKGCLEVLHSIVLCVQ